MRLEAEKQLSEAVSIREKLAVDFPNAPEYRQELAASHNALGNLLAGLGQLVEAEEHYRKALANQEKLAASSDGQELARSHYGLGILLMVQRQGAEADEHFRKALAIQEKLADEFPAVPTYRQGLAGSHNILGKLLIGLGKQVEAEEHYRKAIAIQGELTAVFPDVPGYRRDLATSYNGLGVLQKDLGKISEAKEHYRKALEIQEKLVADFPKVPVYQIELGGGYSNYGILIRDAGQASESLVWFEKALATLGPVYRAEQRDTYAKQALRGCFIGRAKAYDALAKSSDAIKDWDQVVELTAPAEQLGFRASRATSRLRAGLVAEAVAEVADLTKSSKWEADQWYDFACVYAVASGKIADKKQDSADRAMDLLHKAVQAGFNDAPHMQKDTDLDPLRERVDFKKLLAELEKK
jgi:tetratricopeptide (TPR) repeat protein